MGVESEFLVFLTFRMSLKFRNSAPLDNVKDVIPEVP